MVLCELATSTSEQWSLKQVEDKVLASIRKYAAVSARTPDDVTWIACELHVISKVHIKKNDTTTHCGWRFDRSRSSRVVTGQVDDDFKCARCVQAVFLLKTAAAPLDSLSGVEVGV